MYRKHGGICHFYYEDIDGNRYTYNGTTCYRTGEFGSLFEKIDQNSIYYLDGINGVVKAVFDSFGMEKDIATKERQHEKFVDTTGKSSLSVPTPLGDIVVAIKTDSEYPGVYVDLKGENVNDTFEVNTAMLATVEFDPYKGVVQSIVYGDAESEEPTYIVEHENIEKIPSLESQIKSADEVRDLQTIESNQVVDREIE